MSDDVNKTDEGAGKEEKAAGGHEDLKAKLGLRIPEKKPVVEQPKKTAEPKSSAKPADSKQAQSEKPAAAPQMSDFPDDEDGGGRSGVSGGFIGLFIGVALVMAVLGIFVGGVFKGRAIENHKFNEGRHLLEYFNTASVAATGGAFILDTVKAHVEDTKNVFEIMSNAEKPEEIEKARAELEAYTSRCRKYHQIQPYFTVKNAFYDVLFDSVMANSVVEYIDAVRRLYDQTVLFALEADTADRITSLEDTQSDDPSIMFIQPYEKENGETWNKGTWISQIDLEKPLKTRSGIDYAMIEMVSGEAFRAGTTSLVEFDMSPVAMQKSMIHKNAIAARVQKRLGLVVKVADEINWEELEGKLEEKVSRSQYFTFF